MLRVRHSVTVTKPKHKRTGQAGTVETVDTAADKVGVRFDTPDPDGELVEFKTSEVELLPGQQ